MAGGDFLPYGRHLIDEADIAAVVEVLRGGTLTGGPTVGRFDQAIATRVGAPHAVCCINGTAALHLAALALDLGPGDVVVVPAVTFLATANCARYVGAEVLFSDVDPDTGLMRPEDLEACLTGPRARNIRAAIPVHLAGQPCAMPELAEVAAPHGVALIEDGCHALGTTYDDGTYQVGACDHSSMTVFSFHPVKTIAAGEGGAVTTRDPVLARRLELTRSHCIVRAPQDFTMPEQGFDSAGQANPWYHEMQELGFNYRLSDINCALGLSQLGKLDRFLAKRRALVAHYDVQLASLVPIVRPTARVAGAQPGWHLYVALIDFDAAGVERGAAMAALHARGIGTQVHYIPVAWQPYYRHLGDPGPLPGAAEYYRRCLSLPLYPAMTEADVDRVVASLTEVLGAGG